MWFGVVVISLALLFAFSNGFHDAANVVSTIIMTRAISPRKALLMAAVCEFIAPFFLGAAVAKMIGENIINFPPTTQRPSIFLIAFHDCCSRRSHHVEPDYLVFWFSLKFFTCIDWRNGRGCAGCLWAG